MKTKGVEECNEEAKKYYTNPDIDEAKHLQKHDDLLCWYETEYWFDITSFYGKI